MMNDKDKTTEETKITASEESGEKPGQTGTPKITVEESRAEFSQDEAWKELKKKTGNLEKQIFKIEDKVDRFEEKIKDSNLKTIETLGIFVALFTFVSVSFNIFNRVSDLWSAGIFTLLVFCMLALMILLMDILLNLNKVQSIKDLRLLLAFLFVISLIGSLYFLRSFPINPIPNSVEFESSINKKLNDKIKDYLNENNKSFYMKPEIDNLFKQIKQNLQ